MNGNSRTNNRKRNAKRPSEPRKWAQSQNVGAYVPQDDGRNEWCSVLTISMKRSSHMPAMMSTLTMKSAVGLRRTARKAAHELGHLAEDLEEKLDDGNDRK